MLTSIYTQKRGQRAELQATFNTKEEAREELKRWIKFDWDTGEFLERFSTGLDDRPFYDELQESRTGSLYLVCYGLDENGDLDRSKILEKEKIFDSSSNSFNNGDGETWFID